MRFDSVSVLPCLLLSVLFSPGSETFVAADGGHGYYYADSNNGAAAAAGAYSGRYNVQEPQVGGGNNLRGGTPGSISYEEDAAFVTIVTPCKECLGQNGGDLSSCATECAHVNPCQECLLDNAGDVSACAAECSGLGVCELCVLDNPMDPASCDELCAASPPTPADDSPVSAVVATACQSCLYTSGDPASDCLGTCAGMPDCALCIADNPTDAATVCVADCSYDQGGGSEGYNEVYCKLLEDGDFIHACKETVYQIDACSVLDDPDFRAFCSGEAPPPPPPSEGGYTPEQCDMIDDVELETECVENNYEGEDCALLLDFDFLEYCEELDSIEEPPPDEEEHEEDEEEDGEDGEEEDGGEEGGGEDGEEEEEEDGDGEEEEDGGEDVPAGARMKQYEAYNRFNDQQQQQHQYQYRQQYQQQQQQQQKYYEESQVVVITPCNECLYDNPRNPSACITVCSNGYMSPCEKCLIDNPNDVTQCGSVCA